MFSAQWNIDVTVRKIQYGCGFAERLMIAVTIVRATCADRADFFAWRNDPLTRRFSKQREPIPWDTHVAWYTAALASAEHRLLVGYHGTEKIGNVRFDRIDSEEPRLLVSMVIAPLWRRKGYGKPLLNAAIAALPPAIMDAEIAEDNLASVNIFVACGFEPLTRSAENFLKFRRRITN